jgi:hypothetical protein
MLQKLYAKHYSFGEIYIEKNVEFNKEGEVKPQKHNLFQFIYGLFLYFKTKK